MLYEIVEDFPNAIIFEEQGSCISLYQSTQEHISDNKKDTIVFRNLIREIENSLKLKYQDKDIIAIMKPFYQIEDDKNFWNKTLEGLAVLANPQKCIVYKFHLPVKELAVVANSFHIKPLIRIYQSVEKYQLLGLSRNEFTLYQGNRYGYEEIEMKPGTPKTMNDVLGDGQADPYQEHGTFGDVAGTGMYYGHGGKKVETDKDTEKFFRYVDRFVLENYSKPSELPLVLVSLKEYHSLFKKISHNPFLIEEGIYSSYESIEMEQLKKRALEITESIYVVKINNLVDDFKTAKANLLGSDDLEQVAKAAFENRVKTVIIEADRIIPGKINYSTGEVELGCIRNLDCDDILDDIAELVLRNRGNVVILPKEAMPVDTGIAGIYRY